MAEEVLGIRIAPDAWEKSRKCTQPFRDNLARLAEVMKADPVPVSIAELELLEALSGSSTGRGIQEGIKAMDILIHELEERVKAGKGVTEKGAPRVMVRLGHTSDPRVTRLIEESGLAVPLTFILGSWGGIKVKHKGNYYNTRRDYCRLRTGSRILLRHGRAGQGLRKGSRIHETGWVILHSIYIIAALLRPYLTFKKSIWRKKQGFLSYPSK